MKIFNLFFTFIFLSLVITAQAQSRLAANSFYGCNGSFYPVDSSVYYYNNLLVQNNYSSSRQYSYSAGKYDSDMIYIQSFNQKGLVDSLWQMDWNAYHNSYISYNIMATYYDADNNDTSQIEGLWDTTSVTYNNYSKTTYGYDNKGNLLISTLYSWNNAWVPDVQITHQYDQFNNETSIVSATWKGSKWDTSTSGFYKHEAYNYNGKNEDTLEVVLSYNFTTRAFDTVNRFVRTLYKNGYDSVQVNQSWNATPPTWQNSVLDQYSYDTNGNIDSAYHRSWQGTYWLNLEQWLYTYSGYNQVKSEVETAWNGGAYLPIGPAFEEFYYYQTYTGINQVPLNDAYFEVYPNPCTNSVQTCVVFTQQQNLQLHLLNILGQQLWSEDLGNVQQYKAAIPVSTIPSGVYLLQLVTNSGTQTKQLVIEK